MSIFKGYFGNSMYQKLQTRTDRQNISEKYSTIPSNEIWIYNYNSILKKETCTCIE